MVLGEYIVSWVSFLLESLFIELLLVLTAKGSSI